MAGAAAACTRRRYYAAHGGPHARERYRQLSDKIRAIERTRVAKARERGGFAEQLILPPMQALARAAAEEGARLAVDIERVVGPGHRTSTMRSPASIARSSLP